MTKRKRLLTIAARGIGVLGALWLSAVALAVVGLAALPSLTPCDPWTSLHAGPVAAGCTGPTGELSAAMLGLAVAGLLGAPFTSLPAIVAVVLAVAVHLKYR